jgi:diketogulonate reductase-like aldo/keto reductase
VAHALKAGYRGVDGAYCYANEDAVGEGLREAFAGGVRREDVFLVSKVWCTYQSSPERVVEGVDKTLASLGVEYLDLVLIVSWPLSF